MAPTEAEAQCAALNEQELTQGTITDDNDVFLFGGRRVYRHFFSQDREVELYTSSELQQRLGQCAVCLCKVHKMKANTYILSTYICHTYFSRLGKSTSVALPFAIMLA